MRRILLNLSLLALVAAPLAAHATTFDQITFTMTSGTPGVYTFLIPSPPTSFTSDSADGLISMGSIAVSTNGGPSAFDTVLLLNDFGGDGLVDLTQDLQFGGPLLLVGNDVVTPQIFTGTGSGVASIKGGLDQNYTFVSSAVGGAPTPEPSSLALLGTGAVGLLGAFRRRFVA